RPRCLRRDCPPVKMRRKQAIAHQRQQTGCVPIPEKLNSAGVRISCEHLVALERVNANTVLNSWSEFARGEDVRIPPEPVLWIIWEIKDAIGRGHERISEVRSSRIARCRDRDAVAERFSRVSETARVDM